MKIPIGRSLPCSNHRAAPRQIMSYFPPSLSHLSFFAHECRMTRRNATRWTDGWNKHAGRNINRHTTTAATDPILFGQLCCRLSVGPLFLPSFLPSFLGRCPCGAIDRISRLRPNHPPSLLASKLRIFLTLPTTLVVEFFLSEHGIINSSRSVLGQTKRFLRGCENFLPALA